MAGDEQALMAGPAGFVARFAVSRMRSHPVHGGSLLLPDGACGACAV